MTEDEWNRCTDPQKMLAFLRDSRSTTDRKLRFLALACCSRIRHLLSEEAGLLVQTAERYAEGTATRHERDAAVAAFRRTYGRFGPVQPALRAAYSTKAGCDLSPATITRLFSR